jgi:hypothetical protein
MNRQNGSLLIQTPKNVIRFVLTRFIKEKYPHKIKNKKALSDFG